MFCQNFGPEFEKAIERASDVFVTGMARNTFVMTHYGMLENKLRAGYALRFLLIDPSSPAIEMAADRYYAERSASSARERVLHTLRLLTELRSATSGDLSVRLTSHPIAMGIVATDSDSQDDGLMSAVFVEYYTYQAPGEPKFALQPNGALGYELFVNEAKALWDSASPYDLDHGSKLLH